MQRLGYVPALDGVRGVAIALVVAFHYTGWPAAGGAGVDLFFVLSGFLITTLLLEERAETGAVRLSAFYLRRCRRLLPALLAMLIAFVFIAAAKDYNPFPDLWRFGFYTGNLTRAFIDPARSTSSGLGHLWSLAEEEQFYLVWPLLLLLIARTRRLLLLTVLLAVVLVAWRAGLEVHGASAARLTYGPDTRSDGLVVGAILAIAKQRWSVTIPEGGLPWIVAIFAFAVTIPLGGIVGQAVWLPLFEILCAALITAALTESSLSRGLSSRPLVWLGKISYSLYLWHFMVLWAFGGRYLAVAALVSVACAWLSYRFVEQPFRRHRQRARERTAVPVIA